MKDPRGNCLHLGASCGLRDGALVYRCRHPGHQDNPETTAAACAKCRDYFHPLIGQVGVRKPVEPPKLDPQPTGPLVMPDGSPAALGNLFQGSAAFAVLGGPSVLQQPRELLGRRGVLVFTSNNCAASLPAGVRPHVMIHTDNTYKMHWSLWQDPSVLKLTPVREWEHQCEIERPVSIEKPRGIRRRAADGLLEFVPRLRAKQCPNVIGFHRNTTFNPDTFLTEPSFNRGNDKQSHFGTKDRPGNGWPHVINTIFALLRSAYYLGVRRLYLLGADFRMRNDQPYAFNQTKHPGGVASNNGTYTKVMVMLDALRPRFEAAGYQVFNAAPPGASNLWSFPFVDFAEAVERETAHIEQCLNCEGYYDDWTEYRTRFPDSRDAG